MNEWIAKLMVKNYGIKHGTNEHKAAFRTAAA